MSVIRQILRAARAKLASRRGDSLVEALTAILIAVLGATMLATMVLVSVNVSVSSERALSDSYAEESALLSSPGRLEVVAVVLPGDETGATSTVEAPVTTFVTDGYERYLPGKVA